MVTILPPERYKGPVQFDWRNVGSVYNKLWGTGLAPAAEAGMGLMEHWHRMNMWDRTEFRRALQMFNGKEHTRWIGWVPLSIWSAVLEANPYIVQDKKELYKFLKQNPMCAIPPDLDSP